MIIIGMRHAQRRKNSLLDERFITHPRRFFNDGAQQYITGIAIRPLRAGHKIQGFILEEVDQFVQRHVLAPQSKPLWQVGIIFNPAGVGQQIFNGNFLTMRWKVW